MQTKPREWMTAAASRDTAPRIGLIPSTFAGGEEMDGRKIRPLAQPVPLGAALTGAQLDDMLRLAVELGGGRRGGLSTAIADDDWVAIKVQIRRCGAGALESGQVTDPRLVAGVLRYLTGRGLGKRFTIMEGAPCRNQFDGLGYAAMVDEFAKRHPRLRFEVIDLNEAPSLQMPVEGRVHAGRNPKGIYHVPRALRECDKLISIAPLAVMTGTDIGLSIVNYLGFAPGAHYGYPKQALTALGEPGEVALDLFSFHPADYAIVGGSIAAAAAGPRRHNVILAGTNALAVDAVGAAVMGFESAAIRHLELASRRGYGTNDSFSIWTRGAEVDEVTADFRKP